MQVEKLSKDGMQTKDQQVGVKTMRANNLSMGLKSQRVTAQVHEGTHQ